MVKQYFQTGGINTYLNPLLQDGGLIHAVNVTSFPYGAKTKRTGYSTFLGTANGQPIQSLFQFTKNNGTQQFLYRASGGALYYSIQGTGAWTLAGNGTISNNTHVGNAVLDDTLIVGDGVGSTRHTTNGTAFTNTSLAPIGEFFAQFQNRIYIADTSSNLFYSTTNDATNWNTSGTSDSSSFTVPGQGKLGGIFTTADKLITTKNSGLMYKWDGFSLIDMATQYGPSSPYSISKSEDYVMFLNQYGHFGFNGGRPQILSNAIQRQFYNVENTGIAGTALTTIPATTHIYDYFVSVGTITDDFTSRTIPNAIIKYDIQKNEYLNWSLASQPTALFSYKDVNNVQQFIFGDNSGQVYKFDNSTTDNGSAIFAEMVLVFTFGAPEYQKKWNWFRAVFNPGCEIKIQYAFADTYTYDYLVWNELDNSPDGVFEKRFGQGAMGRILFVRMYESSKNSRFTYYGCSIDADIEVKK